MAPDASENSITGSVVEAWTSATISAEGEIEAIIQEAPTAWIRPPKFEARLANQTARKIGCCSGTKGETRAFAGLMPSEASSASTTSAVGWACGSSGMT